MIAYCGLDCSKCDAYKATQTNDSALKAQVAKRWSKELKVNFTPDGVTCDGCKSDRLSMWCRDICKILPCAKEKSVLTCAHCEDYTCDKLDEFLASEPRIKALLEDIRKTVVDRL